MGRRDEQSWAHATGVTPSVGDNRLKGSPEMKTEAQSRNRDREATTARFRPGLFVVAELLCTGALVALVVLYM